MSPFIYDSTQKVLHIEQESFNGQDFNEDFEKEYFNLEDFSEEGSNSQESSYESDTKEPKIELDVDSPSFIATVLISIANLVITKPKAILSAILLIIAWFPKKACLVVKDSKVYNLFSNLFTFIIDSIKS